MMCECCGKRPATQLHHKLPQYKMYKKLYPEFIHDDRNLQKVCAWCHVSHVSADLIHWNELQFCKEFGIKPRSKQYGTWEFVATYADEESEIKNPDTVITP